MRALIFAAGLGERMRPLSTHTPKPLLSAGGKPLIAWHLEKLAAMGVREVAINTSWLAEQFPVALGDGGQWGLRLHFVFEGPRPLETGGGMLNALPWLRDTPLQEEPFLLVNGDIWTDFDFARLPRAPEGLAHLVMVDRPAQATHGDFALDTGGHVRREGERMLTYAGLGIYRPQILEGWRQHVDDPGMDESPPRFRLAPVLRAHMDQDLVRGEYHAGRWTDVGTPDRLAALDADLGAG